MSLDMIKMISILKIFLPLKDLMMNQPLPQQSYTEPEPKEIEVNGKKQYVVIVKLAYDNITPAKNLIQSYNEIDKVLRKLK